MQTLMKMLAFKSAADFRTWLAANHHQQADGFWMRIYKVKSGQPAITYAEALD